MPDRVLRDLHEHLVARLERELDAPSLAAVAGVLGGSLPVDLTRVQHGVAAASDVDEGCFHARQHVLHLAQVDVSDQRGILILGDVVLDQHTVFQHPDLNLVLLGPHDHDPVDGFAAGEELGLGDHRATAPGIAAVTAALLLGLEAGRPLDPLGFGDEFGFAGRTHANNGVRGVVGSGPVLVAGAPTGATTNGRRLVALVVMVLTDVLAGVLALVLARGVAARSGAGR